MCYYGMYQNDKNDSITMKRNGGNIYHGRMIFKFDKNNAGIK